MFSRIQARPVAFTGLSYNAFGDQNAPQNLMGVRTAPTKDEFRHDLNKVVQNMTQPPNVELPDSPRSRRSRQTPIQSAAMSYTGGWANQMDPVMGGAPVPHSDPGFETPNYQNNHKPYFKGAEHQAVPAFMATAADFPVVKNQARVDLPKVSIQRPKTGAKLRAFKNHHPSKSPFSIELPYKTYENA